jgi:hypothetical protein
MDEQHRSANDGADDVGRTTWSYLLDAIEDAFGGDGLRAQDYAILMRLHRTVAPLAGETTLHIPADWCSDDETARSSGGIEELGYWGAKVLPYKTVKALRREGVHTVEKFVRRYGPEGPEKVEWLEGVGPVIGARIRAHFAWLPPGGDAVAIVNGPDGIAQLGLAARTRRPLVRAGVRTISELRALMADDKRLRFVHGIGAGRIAEIREALERAEAAA